MSLSMTSVHNLYMSVIEGVIGGVREFFLDEGVDEQVLSELKHLWETRLKATKAVDTKADKPPQPPIINKPINVTKTGNVSGYMIQPCGGVPVQDVQGNKNVSFQIAIPSTQQQQQGGNSDVNPPRYITIQVPPSALEGNQLHSLLTGPVISATMGLPPEVATPLLHQHVSAQVQQQPLQGAGFLVQTPSGTVRQVDGPNDTSDDDDEEEDEEEEVDDDDDDDADDKEDEENDDIDIGAEEEPLNSGDDVSDEDPSDMFDTDNVVVCQYDKITRTRNKWKFYLKDGIMNLGGKDYVFQKSNGDAEW
ncbi:transcription initiation factor IIA subunit 1 isoform X2 [Cimex lectularius]|uniref:Transcription initiation factor IIA subunit 1 n=1 Tax=Cimex lectularius TaxID=79782 RepID=A0A8I6RS47_CIMLE|nr:transcription initiation factor IIA subunit 1 isoform X2 [Cimex lectularius]